MPIENPYSSPQAPVDAPELIYKPEMTQGKRIVAVVLNVLFFGAPGYFLIDQYAKGVVMGLVSLAAWMFGLGFIPTLVCAVDVAILCRRLQDGDGIGKWEWFQKDAPGTQEIQGERDPTLHYAPGLSKGRIAWLALLNFWFLGAPGYFVLKQWGKGFLMAFISLLLWAVGLGFIPGFVSALDVVYLGRSLRHGEGIGKWQFFERRDWTPTPLPADSERRPGLLYRAHGPSRLFWATLASVCLFGSGYFFVGQHKKAVVTILSTLLLSLVGVGILIPFVAAIDVAVLIHRQRRGQGVGEWQCF